MPLEAANSFFHGFTRLKADHKPLRNLNSGLSFRIPCPSGGAPLDLKNAEIPELNTTFPGNGLQNGIESSLNNGPGLQLSQPKFFRDSSNDVFLGHASLSQNRNLPPSPNLLSLKRFAPTLGAAKTNVKRNLASESPRPRGQAPANAIGPG